MAIRVDPAQPEDSFAIATMVGELLHEIMAALGEPVFGFDHSQTTARARSWMTDGRYTVLVARDEVESEPLGFLALYEGYALYAEGALGTIPELFVRPACRSKGVGARLVAEAKRIGRSKGWTRLEVTTPPLPQFDRTLTFYQREGFRISGGRKMKADLR
jgi:GNAT superfamily N-acetyltransferase